MQMFGRYRKIAKISQTLSRCSEEKNIFHRDIKPENLFWLNNRAVIGDFGLAYFTSRVELTQPGRKFGPLFFLPDEMLNNAKTADPGPADVYMLAKTLWVLATGQNFPPQGEIRTENRQTRLSVHWNDPKAPFLDQLIEKCTTTSPDKRPTMREFFEELSASLLYETEKVVLEPNLRSIGAKLRPSIRLHRENLTLNTNMKKDCQQLLEEIGVLLQPLAGHIAQQTDLQAKVNNENHINTVVRHPDKYNKGGAFGLNVNVVAKVDSDATQCGYLVFGIGLMIAKDIPTISLIGAHAIKGNIDNLLWSKQVEVVPNTARQKQVAGELIDEIKKSLQNSLTIYADHLTNTEPNTW